jgi:hypothetical protein
VADLQYPIGKFIRKPSLSPDERLGLIQSISDLPPQLRAIVAGLTEHQMGLPYRPDGWKIRQVVHHVADSHMNAFIRFKLALTEQEPTIKPYDEKLWAQLDDADSALVESSLRLVEGLHARWTVLLRSINQKDFTRPFNHPERGTMLLDDILQLYAWHGKHHVAHIAAFRERHGLTTH